MDLNKVQIIGNATSDVVLKQTPNGASVATVSVATNRKYTDGQGEIHENAEFHNIVIWGKLAEVAEKYLKKGKKVYFEGRLQTKNWEAKDGTKRYRTEIIAENMILLGNKDSGTANPFVPKNNVAPDEDELSVEDLPF